MNYLRYYWLEDYLFSTVCPRFHRDEHLSAFDFFSIVTWKANRAKAKIAAGWRGENLDEAVRALTQKIHGARDHEERLKILIGRPGIGLLMATAILTVLYPEEFTVYDVRARDALGGFRNIGDRQRPGKDLGRL